MSMLISDLLLFFCLFLLISLFSFSDLKKKHSICPLQWLHLKYVYTFNSHMDLRKLEFQSTPSALHAIIGSKVV